MRNHKIVSSSLLAIATLTCAVATATAQPTATQAAPVPAGTAFDCEHQPTATTKVFVRNVSRPVGTSAGWLAWLFTDKAAAHRAMIMVPDQTKPWDGITVIEDNWAQAGRTATVVAAGRGTVPTAGTWGVIPLNKLALCYCQTQAHMSTYTNGRYPTTPSATGTDAAADGYAIPGLAKPPTTTDPNGTSNCQEFNTMLSACLRANGMTTTTGP